MNLRKSLVSLIILLLIQSAVFGQAKADAVLYLEAVGNEFHDVSRQTMSYTSAVAHGKSARKVEKRRTELLMRIREAERNVRKMKPFENDASLRDSVVAYFSLSYKVLNEDFGKIMNLEEIAEQSYDAMEAYLLAKETANNKLDDAYESVRRQQDIFVAKHNIKIVKNNSKLNQKLETTGKVNQYYNQIYLLFFKSFKDEAYLMNALEKPDVNAKEQTKNALLKSSTEGLQKLGPINSFKGDASLKNACQQLLNFYKTEATTVQTLIDFDLKKENFEKIKKAFEAKRPADRTQADIDLYNKSIKEYNDAVNKTNSVGNDLNKKRNQLLEQWNKTSDQFLDKHTPKYNG
jgi:hypothetical protein